jgi:flagellar biosynthetic protein FliR
MGLGFATLYDASIPGFIPVLGQYMGVIVSLVFLAIDGHLLLLSGLAGSFDALPIAAISAAPGLRSLVEWAGCIFAYSLKLSLPLMAALLITNLALGVLTRAAPQLNIFAVGFPLTILMGLLVLALSLPYFTPVFDQLFRDGLETMLKAAGALRVK